MIPAYLESVIALLAKCDEMVASGRKDENGFYCNDLGNTIDYVNDILYYLGMAAYSNPYKAEDKADAIQRRGRTLEIPLPPEVIDRGLVSTEEGEGIDMEIDEFGRFMPEGESETESYESMCDVDYSKSTHDIYGEVVEWKKKTHTVRMNRLEPTDIMNPADALADVRFSQSLKGVTNRESTVFILYTLCGMGHMSIARYLGISPEAARVAFHRAQKRLHTDIKLPADRLNTERLWDKGVNLFEWLIEVFEDHKIRALVKQLQEVDATRKAVRVPKENIL